MSSNHSFKDPISVSLRVWHWLNGIIIFILLGTVVVGFFFLKGRINAPIIQAELLKAGTEITEETAKAVAKKLSKPIWQWHTYLGYGLSSLFFFRIISDLFEKKENRFFSKLGGWKTIMNSTTSTKEQKHFIWVKLIYIVFYISLFILVSTGLTMAFDDELGIAKEVKKVIKEIHYYTMYSVIAFIVLHLLGLTKAEVSGQKGIVSGMIHGNNE